MGDAAAEQSIERVIEAHGEELFGQALSELRNFLGSLGIEVDGRTIDVVFAIEATQLDVRLVVQDSDGEPAIEDGLTVLRFDIVQLAERYPDCDVGW